MLIEKLYYLYGTEIGIVEGVFIEKGVNRWIGQLNSGGSMLY